MREAAAFSRWEKLIGVKILLAIDLSLQDGSARFCQLDRPDLYRNSYSICMRKVWSGAAFATAKRRAALYLMA